MFVVVVIIGVVVLNNCVVGVSFVTSTSVKIKLSYGQVNTTKHWLMDDDLRQSFWCTEQFVKYAWPCGQRNI